MITEAALYLASPDDAHAALRTVAGRPLAFRALMAAVRAGCRRVHVPSAFRGGDVERWIAATPAARAATVWLTTDAAVPAGPTLLLPAASLVPAATLARLLGAATTTVLTPSQTSGAPVVVAMRPMLGLVWTPLAAGRPLGDSLDRALKADGPTAALPGEWYVRVTSEPAVHDAEARLYAGLGSVVDTRLDTVFHRRLSRSVSRLAVAWGLSPNTVTLASLVVGLAAAGCFWVGSPTLTVAGLVFYAAAVVLDHADGEVARLTLTESRLGEWLDLAVDTVIHVVMVLAMGIAAQRVAGGGAAALGLVAALGFLASAAMFKTSPPARRRGVGGLLDSLSNRDGFYAMLILFILARALWPSALPGLMAVVAAGSHAFWVGRLLYRTT